ncbi:DUF2163 domain-containing protein [Polycladidibacter hongkongensis]|uniref:DUF2163 domain-containing protein n=1 Tax=Polycladidibacter hongkongensis TaxID=1647556 RepID=UPI00082DEDCF|nr:DUF2163 domain-containing protein [Pseudovibrio hongkongensis]
MSAAALLHHLQQEETTTCYCWRLQARSGAALGFTDHDRPLQLNGLTYTPELGGSASHAKTGVGLAVGSQQISGVLSSPKLQHQQIAAGLWDYAEFTAYLVNWENLEQYMLLRRARLGEVSYDGEVFHAQLLSLADQLDKPAGRVLSRQCAASLGDKMCKVDLNDPALGFTCKVASQEGARHVLLDASPPQTEAFRGLYEHGTFSLHDGAWQGYQGKILRLSQTPTGARLTLWLPLVGAIPPGSTVHLRAGCDRSFATCKSRFANAQNFQGFPHMPGNDFVLSAVSGSGPNDGRKLRN